MWGGGSKPGRRPQCLNCLWFVCVLGVWGSAFSILFNRVLGVKEAPDSITMEEELGKHPFYLFGVVLTFGLSLDLTQSIWTAGLKTSHGAPSKTFYWFIILDLFIPLFSNPLQLNRVILILCL